VSFEGTGAIVSDLRSQASTRSRARQAASEPFEAVLKGLVGAATGSATKNDLGSAATAVAPLRTPDLHRAKVTDHQ
jgi:hypothetical protein